MHEYDLTGDGESAAARTASLALSGKYIQAAMDAATAARKHGRAKQRFTFMFGAPGVFASAAAIQDASGNPTTRDTLVAAMIAYGAPLSDASFDIPNELLYGRGGFLQACLFVNDNCSEKVVPDSATAPIVEAMLSVGRKYAAEEYPGEVPLMWSWHGSDYLGAAHGVAGILYVLMRHWHALSEDDVADVKATLDWVLDNCVMASGNVQSCAFPAISSACLRTPVSHTALQPAVVQLWGRSATGLCIGATELQGGL